MFKKILYILIVCFCVGCGDVVEKVINTGVSIPVEIKSAIPLNEQGKVTTDVLLTWETLKNSEYCLAQVFIGTSKENMTMQGENIENCQYQAQNLEYGTTYYWQIKYLEENGNIYEGDILTFTTATATGKITTPILTASDITYDAASLSWNSVHGAKKYFLYKSTEENGEYQEIISPKMVIYYKTAWETTNIHYGTSAGWTSVPGIALEKITEGEYAGWVKYEIEGETFASITFNENGTTWDSNGGSNYTIAESGIFEIEAEGEVKKVEDVENQGFISTECIENNLNYLSNYYYKIKAFDGVEMSDFSQAISFKTTYFEISGLPYLTWNKEDAYDTSIVINYETAEEFGGKVEYGETESLGTTIEGSEIGNIHHINLENLTGNTKYYYRIQKDNDEYSQIYNFTTGTRGESDFNYVLCSDMQDGIDYNDPARKWEEIANEIAIMNEQEKIDFILMPGDFLSNDRPENWKIFFDKGASILPYIPMMPAVGNHETAADDSHGLNSSNPNGTGNFENHFALPGNGTNYVFKYQNAYFTVINSEVLADVDGFTNDPQYDWAKDKIENEASTYDWVFATWHVPAYTVLDRHGEQQVEAREITDFFDGNVDWVFSGHVHSYQRFNPMRYNAEVVDTYGRGATAGVGYINLPPGGNNPEAYEHNDSALLAYPKTADVDAGGISEVGFAKVKIKDNTINIDVYGIGTLTAEKDLHLIDSISYTK